MLSLRILTQEMKPLIRPKGRLWHRQLWLRLGKRHIARESRLGNRSTNGRTGHILNDDAVIVCSTTPNSLVSLPGTCSWTWQRPSFRVNAFRSPQSVSALVQRRQPRSGGFLSLSSAAWCAENRTSVMAAGISFGSPKMGPESWSVTSKKSQTGGRIRSCCQGGSTGFHKRPSVDQAASASHISLEPSSTISQ